MAEKECIRGTNKIISKQMSAMVGIRTSDFSVGLSSGVTTPPGDQRRAAAPGAGENGGAK